MGTLVSIIIPMYNMEDYIERCLSSLETQDSKDCEFIVVDDGSTDRSLQIVKKVKNRFINLRIIESDNRGLANARNLGMKFSEGKYFVFVDSDDYVDGDFIENFRKIIKKETKADVIFSGFKVVDSKKILKKNKLNNDIKLGNTIIADMIGEIPGKDKMFKNQVWGNLYRKDIILKNNILFEDTSYLVSEDLWFNIKYLLNSKELVIDDKLLYNYFINENSITRKINSDLFEDHLHEFHYLNNEFSNFGVISSEELFIRSSIRFFGVFRKVIRQIKYQGASINEQWKMMRKYCSNDEVVTMCDILQSQKLRVSQRIFIFFVKNRFYSLLMLCSFLRII